VPQSKRFLRVIQQKKWGADHIDRYQHSKKSFDVAQLDGVDDLSS
jgi:hypothetical protein